MDHWHHIKNRRSLQSFGQKKKKLKKRDEHILTLDRRRKKTGHGEKSNPFPFLVPASFFSFSFFLAFCKREVIRLRCDQSAVPISPVWWDHREKLSVVVQPPAISGARAASGLCVSENLA
jgi:hypothetical protein